MFCSKTTALINYHLRTLELLKKDLKKERQIVIKLEEQEEIKALRKLSIKDLIKRLK
jgi:hypothetical protein